MNVIESNIQGKLSEEMCEDAIAVTEHFIAVIDGATDKHGWRSALGEAGGRVAAQTIKNAIQFLPEDATAQIAINFLTTQLADEWKRQDSLGFPIDPATPPCAVLTIYSNSRKELWQVGDVGFRKLFGVGDSLYSISEGDREKTVDKFVISLRIEFLKKLLKQGATIQELVDRNERIDDPHWGIIRMQDIFANVADSQCGFGVINGHTNVPTDFISVFRVPESTKEIIIASDGYPLIGSTLEATQRYLNEALKRDPLCIGELRGSKSHKEGLKSYDDATYLRFTP